MTQGELLTRRPRSALSSVPERHRGWCWGPGEKIIWSREIPDLACGSEMTCLVTEVRAVDNKIKCTYVRHLKHQNVIIF